jgi:hypothetical protein
MLIRIPQKDRLLASQAVTARILIGIAVVILSGCHVFAQQMGQTGNYSDSWVDDSNPDNVVILGSGTTQDSYNNHGHTYWNETTVTSPAGRTTSGSSYRTDAWNAYTRVEISLPWDWNDLGDYFIQSEHWTCCPYLNGDPSLSPPESPGCYPIGDTSLAAKAGASRATYSLTSQNFCCCTYNIIPNCYIRCGPPEVSRAQVSACKAYIQRIQSWFEVYGHTFCVPDPIFFVESDNWLPCTEDQQ